MTQYNDIDNLPKRNRHDASERGGEKSLEQTDQHWDSCTFIGNTCSFNGVRRAAPIGSP